MGGNIKYSWHIVNAVFYLVVDVVEVLRLIQLLARHIKMLAMDHIFIKMLVKDNITYHQLRPNEHMKE